MTRNTPSIVQQSGASFNCDFHVRKRCFPPHKVRPLFWMMTEGKKERYRVMSWQETGGGSFCLKRRWGGPLGVFVHHATDVLTSNTDCDKSLHHHHQYQLINRLKKKRRRKDKEKKEGECYQAFENNLPLVYWKILSHNHWSSETHTFTKGRLVINLITHNPGVI